VSVRALTAADLDWVVARVAERRAALAPYAPVFWRPAAHAEQAHRRFLGYLLTKGGARGFRTEDALLIAAPATGARTGWTVDDVFMPPGQWAADGQALWNALAETVPGAPVRFVCPVQEPDRAAFARGQGLRLADSWWHLDAPSPQGAARRGADAQPRVDGADAFLVPAPRIYDPGGPALYLSATRDPARALPSAHDQAVALGSPVIVVNQPAADAGLAGALAAAGYRRHCDYLDGTVSASRTP
jgi:hypothetical protein